MSFVGNKQIAQKFIDEIFNKGNLEEVSKFVTPDFIYHARGEDVTGMEKFKQCVASDPITFHDNFEYMLLNINIKIAKIYFKGNIIFETNDFMNLFN